MSAQVYQIIERIHKTAMEIAFANDSRLGSATHSIRNFINKANAATEMIESASNISGFDERQRNALLKKNVAELSAPDVLDTLKSVFSLLAKWRDETQAKESVKKRSQRALRIKEDSL